MRRALIVAIESYPRSQGIDTTLPGTSDAGVAFRDWLLTSKQVPPANILFCAETNATGRTHGTNRADVIGAIFALVQAGKDTTDELYVFFSGHGFAYPTSPSRKPVDVLVGADFEQPAQSGGACLKLQEIQTKLWYAMGPGNHYYFVDACRTLVQPTDINVPDSGVLFGTSDLGRPTVYTICSTTIGQPAWVASGFPKALINGLAGDGRAKGWNGARLVVTFDLLCRYLLSQVVRQPIDSTQEGSGDGVLLEIAPVPAYACDIVVDGAQPADAFVATVLDSRRRPLPPEPFSGPSHSLTLTPDDYFVTVTSNGTALALADPPSPPIDLYEPRRLRFQKAAPPAPLPGGLLGAPAAQPAAAPVAAQPASSAPAMLNVTGGGPTTVEITQVQTGEQVKAAATFNGELAPGTYSVKVQQAGDTVASKDVTLLPGRSFTLDLSSMRFPSPVSTALINALPAHARAGDLTWLSESLGEPLASSDPGLLLSLAGASRIVAQPSTFTKLGALPLATFDDLAAGQSAIYVLTGRENANAPSRIKIGDGDWHPLPTPGTLATIGEERRIVPPGAQVVSFHATGHQTASVLVRTYASYVTMLVVTLDRTARLRCQQFALPAWHLAAALPPSRIDHLLHGPRSPLQTVWACYVMQRQFAKRQRLAPADAEPSVQTWQALCGGTWIDPVMTALAAYDLVRAGLRPDARASVATLASALRAEFASPDAEAIAKLAGQPYTTPASPPAMLDGVMALDAPLPLPADHLDYESPWTVWRGAIEAPA